MDSPSKSSDTNRSGGRVSAILRKEVVDYRSTVEPLLPVSEASVVQLRPGPPPSNLAIFSSDKVSILGLQHYTASVGVIIIKPECFSFMWWDGSEDCRINGETARRTVLYAQGGQDGFHAAGGARKTMGIAVRRNDLIETVAALQGIGPEDVFLKHTSLELSPAAATGFRAGVQMVLRSAVESGGDEMPGATADPSEAIFGLLVDTYLSWPPLWSREYRTHPPERIVRTAEERYFASEGDSVSLADLCRATGASQSALYRAFHAVCGEPPLSYFHKRRLDHARSALIKSPVRRGAVKRVAIDVGFTELGRFSVEYRQLFGESPSVTLSRNILF